jgi:hypothetical protein
VFDGPAQDGESPVTREVKAENLIFVEVRQSPGRPSGQRLNPEIAVAIATVDINNALTVGRLAQLIPVAVHNVRIDDSKFSDAAVSE